VVVVVVVSFISLYHLLPCNESHKCIDKNYRQVFSFEGKCDRSRLFVLETNLREGTRGSNREQNRGAFVCPL
jgi:hypothetical protein